MEQANITGLLYQQESETLDFKRDQYPLGEATNETIEFRKSNVRETPIYGA